LEDLTAEDKQVDNGALRRFWGLFSSANLNLPLDFEASFESAEFDAGRSDVTVVVPTLNEESNIGNTIRQIHYAGFRNVLVIDGDSRDRTIEIAKDLGVNVAFQKGRGKGVALRQAFGIDGIGDRVVIMDADGSMDAKEIFTLLQPLDAGADVVKASRFMRGGFTEDMTPIRKIGNGFFVFLVNCLWRAKYTDLCYGFAVFSKRALARLVPELESTGFEIETELFIKARKLGLTVVEVPSVERARKNGVSNLNAVKDGFRILKTILQEAVRR
jgi:glycosyltransferase involved in cell wall biosynthesis